ncbi:hypothetical protein F3087_00700 [Nocardia colli]|uniref:Uncharacterized protein n=1 Tax=Nocardia colli TaxID=2545717 RepID=A0A5N0EKV3_9NOCA|nr:hypothetical protein [Nocardia colli]KAA8889882.1 hypothetical protein F3087_00700 [Nocardia colli]
MNVGKSVQHSLDQWALADWDAAMLHACNAVDGTGKKRYPAQSVTHRFKQVLRDDLDILHLLGVPGIDLEKTRFPVPAKSNLPGKRPDIADVIYGIHRCTHGHGDELPAGFELIEAEPLGTASLSKIVFEEGKIALSNLTIIGLLGVAVFAPENAGQQIAPEYYLSVFDQEFTIADWWGRADDFRAATATVERVKVEMDWTDWWDNWQPL